VKDEKTESKTLVQIENSDESKKASITADPLLTNPLNSCTKLRIRGTFQNKFLPL
jgi:hypothetical protein